MLTECNCLFPREFVLYIVFDYIVNIVSYYVTSAESTVQATVSANWAEIFNLSPFSANKPQSLHYIPFIA